MFSLIKWWKDFLERLAEASEKEFGGKPPECCAPKKMQDAKRMHDSGSTIHDREDHLR